MNRILFLLPLLGLAFTNETPPAAPRVDDFDKVIQERFGNLTEEDIHQGRLGVSRIARPARRRLFVPTEAEKPPLVKLQEEGWSTSIYVLGTAGNLTGPIRTDAKGLPAGVKAVELTMLGNKAIRARGALQEALGAVRLEARPIPVSGPNCAGCHDPSLKQGDPLGAVVYVFQRREAP